MKGEQNIEKVNFIPDDISRSFNPLDIPMVFGYLEKTFQHIEPPINRLRIREDSLFSMLRFLLKDRMAERELQENRYGSYYDRGGKFKKQR